MLVQAGLSSIQAWPIIFSKLHLRSGKGFFASADLLWITASGMLALMATSIAAAKVSAKFGTRRTMIGGGLLLGAGYLSAALFSIPEFYQTIASAVLIGAASGLLYILSLTTGLKWYPEKKGLIAGAILAASALGSLVWLKAAEIFFRNGTLAGPEEIRNPLLISGIISALVVLAGSALVADTPAGYVPPVWRRPENPLAAATSLPEGRGLVFRSLSFYLVAVSLFLASAATVFFCFDLRCAGKDMMATMGLEIPLAERIAGLAALILVISDGLGRLAWGYLSDIFGTKESLVVLGLLQGVVIFLVTKAGGNTSILIFAALVTGFSLGGCFSIFPAITSDYFGEDNITRNYGIMFSFFIAAAILGIYYGSVLEQRAITLRPGVFFWTLPFCVAGSFCIVASVLVILAKPAKIDRQVAVVEKTQAQDTEISGTGQ